MTEMRRYIDLIGEPAPPPAAQPTYAFFTSLQEARRPMRRPMRPAYVEPEPEPEPEPEHTLHGDLGDTAEQGPQHMQNLVGTELGADDVSDEQAMQLRGQYGDDEDFEEFLHHQSVETGQVIPQLWRQIRQLPHYVQNNVRSMGRMIFGRLTDTPIENIYVLGTAFGNEESDVRTMIEWLQRYGTKEHFAPYDFSNIMPGYQAKQVLYGVGDYQMLAVRDAMGLYVYAWKRDR